MLDDLSNAAKTVGGTLPALLLTVATVAAAMDSNRITRAVAVALIAAAAWYYIQSSATVGRVQGRTMLSDVLGHLPVFVIDDASVCALTRTPRKYREVAANPRILSVFHRIKALRRYNDHYFALALTYVEHMLRLSRVSGSLDAQYLGLLKDKTIDALQNFGLCVPEEKLRAMRFASVLRLLDTVLYREAIHNVARIEDVYPIAHDRDQPHNFTGHS